MSREVSIPRTAWMFALALVGSLELHAAPPVSFERSESQLQIRLGDRPLATYVTKDDEIKRPYFAHLFAPDGTRVTRNHPPLPDQDKTDHATMHPGLWLAFGDLNGKDFWRNRQTVEHVEYAVLPHVTPTGGQFSVRNRYLDGSEIICEEVCRFRVDVHDDRYLIDWTSEFRSHAEIVFGDQEEMGLGIRVSSPLAVAGGGQIRNSLGQQNEEQVWGQAADWCDYARQSDGGSVGITILGHPDNFRSCWFHARDYGLLVANPFGRHAFRQGDRSEVRVPPGEVFRLRFGVLVRSGDVDVAEIYRLFAVQISAGTR